MMRRDLGLIGLLLVTNGAWVVREMGRPEARLESADVRAMEVRPLASPEVFQVDRGASKHDPDLPLVGEDQAAKPAPPTESPSPVVRVSPEDAKRVSVRWNESIRQRDDPLKRDSAMSEIRTGLTSDDDSMRSVALHALISTNDVKVDRTGFAELVRPLVESSNPHIRLSAWQSLILLGAESLDVEKLRLQIRRSSPESLRDLVLRLNWATKGVLEGADEQLLMEMWAAQRDAKPLIAALQNTRLGPALTSKVLEFARSGGEEREHAEHFVLRKLPVKSREIDDFLMDSFERGKVQSLQGLAAGVQPEDVEYVGSRLRNSPALTRDNYARIQIIDLLGRLGDESSMPWLTEIRDKTTEDTSVRDAATKVIGVIRRMKSPK